jgi:hypothetical protein
MQNGSWNMGKSGIATLTKYFVFNNVFDSNTVFQDGNYNFTITKTDGVYTADEVIPYINISNGTMQMNISTTQTLNLSVSGSCLNFSNSTHNVYSCDRIEFNASIYINYDGDLITGYTESKWISGFPNFTSRFTEISQSNMNMSQYSQYRYNWRDVYGDYYPWSNQAMYISFNDGWVLRTDALTPNVVNTTTTNRYKAYILSSANTIQITPILSYYPGLGAYPYYTNITDGTAYAYANQAMYIVGTDGSCYFIPANSATNLSSIYTLTAYPAANCEYYYNISTPTQGFVFYDVRFYLYPENSTVSNYTNITYSITANSSLNEWGMSIDFFNLTSGNWTGIYSQNSSNSSGGNLTYYANESGRYRVNVFFNHTTYGFYTPTTYTYSIAINSSWNQARDYWADNPPISGWAYYFFALVVAMLVAGFVSRYAIDGAGWVGLLVLWAFTIFWPSAQIACIGGYDALCIDSFTATVATTGVYAGAAYLGLSKVGI